MISPQLRVFVCVADSGSFNKAAETLYLSSTAVMKQITTLEKRLNLMLLNRTHHGVTLTPEGKVLYKHAKVLFEYAQEALEEAQKVAQMTETTFCVGTSILNPCKPFMDLWNQVGGEFLNYKLHIIPFEDDHQGILGEVEALGKKFDFLVGACDSKQWLDRCNFLPLGTYRYCVAVPQDHPLAGKDKLTIEDMEGETLMLVRQGDSPSVDQVRAALKEHSQIHLEDTPPFYDMEVFNSSVQTRHLLLTLDCWKDVHPLLVTLPVAWDFTIPYGILYELDPVKDVQRFLNLVQTR